MSDTYDDSDDDGGDDSPTEAIPTSTDYTNTDDQDTNALSADSVTDTHSQDTREPDDTRPGSDDQSGGPDNMPTKDDHLWTWGGLKNFLQEGFDNLMDQPWSSLAKEYAKQAGDNLVRVGSGGKAGDDTASAPSDEDERADVPNPFPAIGRAISSGAQGAANAENIGPTRPVSLPDSIPGARTLQTAETNIPTPAQARGALQNTPPNEPTPAGQPPPSLAQNPPQFQGGSPDEPTPAGQPPASLSQNPPQLPRNTPPDEPTPAGQPPASLSQSPPVPQRDVNGGIWSPGKQINAPVDPQAKWQLGQLIKAGYTPSQIANQWPDIAQKAGVEARWDPVGRRSMFQPLQVDAQKLNANYGQAATPKPPEPPSNPNDVRIIKGGVQTQGPGMGLDRQAQQELAALPRSHRGQVSQAAVSEIVKSYRERQGAAAAPGGGMRAQDVAKREDAIAKMDPAARDELQKKYPGYFKGTAFDQASGQTAKPPTAPPVQGARWMPPNPQTGQPGQWVLPRQQ